MTAILVVDDEPDIRELIRFNLELEGFDVVTAEDGAAGLVRAQSQRPDCIVLDVSMPGLTGWQVLERLKADAALASVPVLMLTAHDGELDRVRGGIEGAVRYLIKPFDVDNLRRVIGDVLSGAPEPVQRRQAQDAALSKLARLEGGNTSARPPEAHPRLTRLDGAKVAPSRPQVHAIPVGRLETLSAKQRELIAAVAKADTVSQAADHLAVSRSNVYASLRRIARKLGVGSVSELVSLARSGGLT